MRKIIIPAAGFGTRVGSPAAKELMINHYTKRPLIDFSIELSKKFQATPVVITRYDKTELINYLQKDPKIELALIEKSREWPESPLLAKAYWGEENILVLPDTYFQKIEIVAQLFNSLKNGNNYSFATFEVENSQLWGMLAESQGKYLICEKPTANPYHAKAWGLFGFKKESGEELFEKLLSSNISHQWEELSGKIECYHLDFFSDLTRKIN